MIVPMYYLCVKGLETGIGEKSQCKLSSERKRGRAAAGTLHLKSQSVTSFMRKECKARCTPSLPGLSCAERVRKAGQGDEVSVKFQPARLRDSLNASKLTEKSVNTGK